MQAGLRMAGLALVLGCMVLPAWGGRDGRLLSAAGPTFTIVAPTDGWTLIAYGRLRFTDRAIRRLRIRRRGGPWWRRFAAEKPDALL